MEPSEVVRLRSVWQQQSVPVVYRRGPGNPILVRLPYAIDNRPWLAALGRREPKWDRETRRWEVPQRWFTPLVRKCLARYGKVHVIQPFFEQQKCAPACWDAHGEECECSCMGVNHGSGHPEGNWKIVSDAFATRWHGRYLSCRLITKNSQMSDIADLV